MSRQPVTKWAQRSDKVLITFEIPDAKDVKLTLQPDAHLHFSAATGAYNVSYEIDFVLYDKINVHESKGAVGSKKVCYILKKAEEKWWSRLLRQGGRPPVFLKADWDKWIDEDDQPEKEFEDLGFGELEFLKLNMGGVEDDEPGEAKTTKNPPAAKEFEAAADAKEDHDAGSHYLGVDWLKMNTDMKKYLNMEYGAKQRAMFVDDDDDDDEEDAADEEEDAADEDEGDEKKEAKAPPADQNVEDAPLSPFEILNVQIGVQMVMDMADMADFVNGLMDDGVAEDSVDEHEDDETESHPL